MPSLIGGLMEGLIASQQRKDQMRRQFVEESIREASLKYQQEQDALVQQQREKEFTADSLFKLMGIADRGLGEGFSGADLQPTITGVGRALGLPDEVIPMLPPSASPKIAANNADKERRFALAKQRLEAMTDEARKKRAMRHIETLLGQNLSEQDATISAMLTMDMLDELPPLPSHSASGGQAGAGAPPVKWEDYFNLGARPKSIVDMIRNSPLSAESTPKALMQEGEAESRNRLRAAQKLETDADTLLKAKKAAEMEGRFRLDALRIQTDAAYKDTLTQKVKTLLPAEVKRLEAQIAEMKNRIAVRSETLAQRGRNQQLEYKLKQETAADKRGQLIWRNLQSIRTQTRTFGNQMTSAGKNRDAALAEAQRLDADRQRGVPSDVRGGTLEGPARDAQISALTKQAEDFATVHEAAKKNFQHYRNLLEEGGALTILKKPKPPALTPPARKGASGLAPVLPPPGAKKAPKTPSVPASRTNVSKMSDEELMARLRKKYMNR